MIAAAIAILMTPSLADAQPKPPKPVKIAAKDTARGMADTPAMVQALGISCQVANARLLQEGKDPKTKVTTGLYEVACAGAPGFILQGETGKKPVTFDCIKINSTPVKEQNGVACVLPENLDHVAAMATVVKKSPVPCVPTNARGIGANDSATFMEVVCQDGNGYIVTTSSPIDLAKPVELQPCIIYDERTDILRCTLTDKASRSAQIDRYVAESKVACTVKERRYAATAKDGSIYYETSCTEGKGFIYHVASDGKVADAVDCAKSTMVTCTLTNAREAATEQASTYTRLAKANGSNCDVDKYGVLPVPGTVEVVELVCKDGSGGIALFEASGKGAVYDCGHALAKGYQCSNLNKPGLGYAELTADLKKQDVKTCEVSNARLAATKTSKGTALIEVACADGLKGYMIEYNPTPTLTVVGATGCAFWGGDCKLPGNT